MLFEKVTIALYALFPDRIVKSQQCFWLVQKKYLGGFGLLGSPTSEKFSVLHASLGQEPLLSLYKTIKGSLTTLLLFPSITQSAGNKCSEMVLKKKVKCRAVSEKPVSVRCQDNTRGAAFKQGTGAVHSVSPELEVGLTSWTSQKTNTASHFR